MSFKSSFYVIGSSQNYRSLSEGELMRSKFTISQKCPRDLLYRELFRMQNVYPEDGRFSILGENI